MVDLERLHSYTTSTSLTLASTSMDVANVADVKRVWQEIVPRIAFSHEFLMHGLLAFSALHSAHLHPERKKQLLAEASARYDHALVLFHPAMAAINQHNCNACFAFSALIMLITWNLAEKANTLFFDDPMEASAASISVEWVKVLRGVSAVLSSVSKWIRDGPLRPLIQPWINRGDEKSRASILVNSDLAGLKNLWVYSQSRFSSEEVAILDETLDILQQTEARMSDPQRYAMPEVAAALSWPSRISEKYLDMVATRMPEALILLAHYCVFLHRVDRYWYVSGMGAHLLQSIRRCLSTEWRAWLQWPLQVVGCVERD